MPFAVQLTFGFAGAPSVRRVFFDTVRRDPMRFKWLASIIRVDRLAVSCASISKIRSKMSASDQRFQRLQSVFDGPYPAIASLNAENLTPHAGHLAAEHCAAYWHKGTDFTELVWRENDPPDYFLFRRTQ